MKNSINIFSETGCIPHDVLWKYRQGKLTASEKHAVEVHLTDCELCSDALAGMLNLQSDEMMEGLRKSVRKISSPKKIIRFYDYRILSAAAAVTGLVIVFTYVINSSDKEHKKEIAQLVKPKKPEQEQKKNEASPPVANLSERSASKAKDTAVVQKHSENSYKKTNININPTTVASNAARIPSLPTSGEGYFSAADADKKAEPGAEKDVTMRMADSTFTNSESYGVVAPSPYTVTTQNVKAVSRDDEKSLAFAKTKSTAKKFRKESSSEVRYFSDLKVSVTPAMTESEKLDSVNTGTPAMYENAESKTSEPVGREMPFVYSKTLRDGMNYFHNKQYPEASQNFSIIMERLPDDVNAQFYKGLSEMELHNYAPASELLKKAMLNSDKTFYEEAKFKLALCYIAINKKEDAEKLLREIKSEKGFYSEKATEELQRLK